MDLPALGFGMGDVVLYELLKARKLLPAFDPGVDIFVLIENGKKYKIQLTKTLIMKVESI